MNRNNRLCTEDASGKKNFTTLGLLLQFFAIAEGWAPATRLEMDRSREIVDEIMEDASLESPTFRMLDGAIEERLLRLLRVVDMLEGACAAIGEARALEIIHRPYAPTIH